MLDRHRSCADGTLERRNVAEDEDNDDSEDHSRKERPILGRFVEYWWLLEDAESAGASSE